MVNVESKTDEKKKAGARWISWLFGLAILVAVALFAAHRSEERDDRPRPPPSALP